MTRSRRNDNEDTNQFNSKTLYSRKNADTDVITQAEVAVTDNGDGTNSLTVTIDGSEELSIGATGTTDFKGNTVTGIANGVDSTDAVNRSQLGVDGVFYNLKQKRTAVNSGSSAKTNYVHNFSMAGASTTVASEALLNQKDVILTSATGFVAGQWVLLSEGTSAEEWGQIDSVAVNTLTLKSNLLNTHAGTNTAVNDDEHFFDNNPKAARLVVSGTTTELPWMFTDIDESSKTAEVSVLIPSIGASSTYSFDIMYKTTNTEGYSRPDEVFRLFDSGNGDAGDIPSGYERSNGITIDANNRVEVSASNALTYKKPNFTPEAIKNFVTNTTADKTTASRVPHQRSSFYSSGRWWFFYGKFVGTKPYDLAFDSTDDGGETWKGETVPTEFVDVVPKFAAQYEIVYDDINDKVWVCTNISETTSTEGIHGGLQIRRYSLSSDGTISDDSGSWQVVNDETIFTGDFAGKVLSNGKLAFMWSGKEFGGGGGNTIGDAVCTKQASAGASWSEDSNFPIQLTNTDDNRQSAGIARLNNGGMALGSGRWNADTEGLIYVFDDDDDITPTLAKTTTLPIEATAGSGAAVSRFEVDGHNNEIHYTYQDSKQHIYYGKRDTSGTWVTEVLVSGIAGRTADTPTGGHVKSDATSPRLSFWDDNSAVVITWSEVDLDTIFMAIVKDDLVQHIYPIFRDTTNGLNDVYEHAMPAELFSGDEISLTWLSDESDPITKSAVVTFDGGFVSSTKSVVYEKQDVTSGILNSVMSAPSIPVDGTMIVELSLYHVSISTGVDDNDNYSILFMEEDGSGGTSTGGLFVYGDPVATGGTNSFGYFDGSHNKGLLAAEPSTRYKIGLLPKAATYDIYVDGVLVQEDAVYNNIPTGPIDKLHTFFTSVHVGEFHINSVTVRPFDGTDTTGGRGSQPTG